MQPPDEKLHEQAEWLRVTLSSIGDAVITTDIRGDVTFLNPVAEKLTGWPLNEAIGQPLERVFHIVNEETRYAVESPATRSLREGLIVGLANHTVLIARDGSEWPIDDSAAPIQDISGNVAGAVLVFRDVTEQRRQDRILRESEERFRLLVESVKDYAIFMLDPQGHVVSWNAGAQHINGYAAEEIIGQHFSRFYTPEAIATNFPQHELETAKAVGRFEDEGWRVRKDGTLFWANVVITAVHDKSGTLIGFAKVTRDLTQRRELERTKAQSEALVDLNRRKDEFLAMLSHELRNPLAPISTTVQLLRLDLGSDPARQPAISILERQVAHLTRLVDDLLEVSRISTGRIRLQPELIDLRRVADRAVEAVHVLTSRRGVACHPSSVSNAASRAFAAATTNASNPINYGQKIYAMVQLAEHASNRHTHPNPLLLPRISNPPFRTLKKLTSSAAKLTYPAIPAHHIASRRRLTVAPARTVRCGPAHKEGRNAHVRSRFVPPSTSHTSCRCRR